MFVRSKLYDIYNFANYCPCNMHTSLKGISITFELKPSKIHVNYFSTEGVFICTCVHNSGSHVAMDKCSMQKKKNIAIRVLLVCCALEAGSNASKFFFLFQEGANINKSLTTLGKVISALAEQVITQKLKEKVLQTFFLKKNFI